MNTDQAADAEARSSNSGPLLRPTSQVRATVFFCVNLLAYAFISAFVHYVSSGRWVSISVAGYVQSAARPLGAMLLEPLSIFTHPWMIPVTSLLISGVVVVPLLVACLYHSRYCGLFLLCTALLACAPVLALVLAAGCTLVAVTPLRRRNPALALLLGLMPVGAYLYLAVRRQTVVLLPMQRLVMYGPFLLAAAGAVVAGAIVLLIAHWTRYRTGVIWPVIAVLLGVPAAVFYSRVGTDELAFALLAGELTPAATAFEDEFLPRAGGGSTAAPPPEVMDAARKRLDRRKAALVAKCRRFARRHGDSPRLPAILWIEGITLDTRLCVRSLRAGYVRHYDHVPRPASEATWRRLEREFPADSHAAVALYRLARADVAAGRFKRAAERLAAAAQRLGPLQKASPAEVSEAPWYEQIFAHDSGPPGEQYLRRVAHEIAMLHALMRDNDVAQNSESALALAALIRLDPRQNGRREYREKIIELAERFAETNLADNLALAVALDISDPVDRAVALGDLENEPGCDASIRANYELGQLALQTEQIPGLGRLLERPEVYFKRVVAAVVNPWQAEAQSQLARLRARETARR